MIRRLLTTAEKKQLRLILCDILFVDIVTPNKVTVYVTIRSQQETICSSLVVHKKKNKAITFSHTHEVEHVPSRHTRPPTLASRTSPPPHTTLALFSFAMYGRGFTADTSASAGQQRNLSPLPPAATHHLLSKISFLSTGLGTSCCI